MSRDDLRAAEAIRAVAASVRAPERLREELRARRARRRARRRLTVAATGSTVAAALAVLLAPPRPAGDARPPSIAEAAAVALRDPALPAPARDASDPALLGVSAGGVRFPDYGYGGLGWRPAGLLRARRGGRDVVVVSYARADAARAGYAIVAGPALRVAAGAPTVTRDGTRFAVLRDAGATIVTWRRGGRTCVLASRQASAGALLRMAAWRPHEGRPGPY